MVVYMANQVTFQHSFILESWDDGKGHIIPRMRNAGIPNAGMGPGSWYAGRNCEQGPESPAWGNHAG